MEEAVEDGDATSSYDLVSESSTSVYDNDTVVFNSTTIGIQTANEPFDEMERSCNTCLHKEDQTQSDTTPRMVMNNDIMSGFVITDRVITFYFLLELFVRFSVCPYKRKCLKSAFNIIDILAIVPWTVIQVLLQASHEDFSQFFSQEWVQIYSRFAGVLRVVRLISLARHYVAARVFLITVWESRKEMMLLLSLYVTGATFFAVATYYCEQGNNEQFSTMAAGIWWAIITMSTVGYGDITLQSELGKTIGVMCAFSGVICTALPVAVIATNYSIIYKTAKVRNKLNSLADGTLCTV